MSTPTIANGNKPTALNTENLPPTFSAKSKALILLSLANLVNKLFDSETTVQLLPSTFISELIYLNKLMVSTVLPDFEITIKCVSPKSTFFRQ